MSLGSIRTSSEVAHGAERPSVAGRLSVSQIHLEPGRPFDGAAASGAAYQHLGLALDKRHERKVKEVSAETAQKIQSALSETSINLYQRKEMSADGIVKAWDAECQKAVKEAGANLDPDTRKAFEQRMAPWMAGRRENLMEHQFREVRRGRVNALENDMRTTATAETDDILALANSEQVDWNARLASGTKPEDIAAERDKAFDTHFQQMMAVQSATETRYADAVAQGLYGAEEAKSRCLKSRHDAAKTLLDASLDAGNDDFAEYTLTRLGEPEPEPKKATDDTSPASTSPDASAPSDAKPDAKPRSLGAACGLSADELAGYRAAIQRVRDRRAADRKREAAAREERARDAAREREIALHLRPIPADEAGQAAYFERMGVDYAELAADPTLPPETRLGYAKTARALGFQSLDSKAAVARRRKAEEREAKAERREQLRELKALVKESQEEAFAMHESDFKAGGYFDKSGVWHDHTAASMKEVADAGLANGNLSRLQWHKLMTMQQKQYVDEMGEFRNLVMADVKRIVPSCITWHRDRFQLSPSTRVNAATATTLKGGLNGDLLTYRQLVEAMNRTVDWWKAHGRGADVNAAKKHFDDLTQGIVNGRMQATIDDALEEANKVINDWRSTHGL